MHPLLLWCPYFSKFSKLIYGNLETRDDLPEIAELMVKPTRDGRKGLILWSGVFLWPGIWTLTKLDRYDR